MDTEGVAPALADWIRRTSSALDRLHTRDVVHAMTAWNDLDNVRQELDRATEISESRLLALHRRLDVLQAERNVLQAERDRLHDRATVLELQVHGLEIQSAERLRVLVEAQQDAKALRASISWRLTSPLRVAGRIFR
jgi:predicted  nucleic acid-binding Zn-ribbon protein